MSRLEKIVVGHDLQAGGEMAARSAAELAIRCGAHRTVPPVGPSKTWKNCKLSLGDRAYLGVAKNDLSFFLVGLFFSGEGGTQNILS